MFTPNSKDFETLDNIRKHLNMGEVRVLAHMLKIECFSRDELEWLKAQLTPEEKAKVAQWTWLEFKPLDQPSSDSGGEG